MTYRWTVLSTIVGGIALLAGCKSSTDLGTDCTMVKKNPNGPGSIPILESDLPAGHKDFISFGATECEDLVCVRDANVQSSGVAGAVAKGYCSRACSPGSSCPSANSSNDSDPNLMLSCRPLILDQQTLSTLCSTDPPKCIQYFGGTTSPYFCARGATPSP